MIDESRLPPGVLAEVDQHGARVREGTDQTIDVFAEMLRDDPRASQAAWSMIVGAVMTPGQLAALATELLFRAARERAKAL